MDNSNKSISKTSSADLIFNQYDAVDNSYPLDYHLHTDYTDGTVSAKKMSEAAIAKGIREVLFCEHIRSTSTYFPSYAKEIRSLTFDNFKAHIGVETKILDTDGNLDCPSEVYSYSAAIVGSVHRIPNYDDRKSITWKEVSLEEAIRIEFELASAIIDRSRAHILGHPMGMVISNWDFFPEEQLIQLAYACEKHNKVFELNSRYCPDPNSKIDIVQQAGCKISFGSDAHSTKLIKKSWDTFVERQKTI